MKSLTCVKKVQILSGRLAALNQFFSRSTNKCKPFFQAIKKNGTDFCWDEQCAAAFQSLKAYLASPPLLFKPIPDETMFLYLVVSDTTVGPVLIREDEGVQKPVYYVKFLVNAQTRYTKIKKLIFEATKRIAKWVTKIRSLRVTFKQRAAIIGQVLADFVAEFTPGPPPQSNLLKGWILNVDGASNGRGTRIWIALTTLKGSIIEQFYTLGFHATNNEAECEAVIAGFKMAAIIGIVELEVRCDSLLIVSQVNGEYTIKDDRRSHT